MSPSKISTPKLLNSEDLVRNVVLTTGPTSTSRSPTGCGIEIRIAKALRNLSNDSKMKRPRPSRPHGKRRLPARKEKETLEATDIRPLGSMLYKR